MLPLCYGMVSLGYAILCYDIPNIMFQGFTLGELGGWLGLLPCFLSIILK